ncbi:DUF883 domain-containing protein [Stappia sp. WLB 29]|uniref:DUF883 family protein n=1 Tax=Stappia sp. WLB 29 TaxID=2925220 RepID=UPI0020C1791E|nr:DUF883 domain-containing protein [Stappia sp. WLB 29]
MPTTADTKSAAAAAKAARADDEAASIQENIERLRGDISSLAKSISRYGTEKTGEYTERASKAGKDIADVSQQTLDSLTEELNRLERSLTAHVRRKPLQSLGIAAGIGFLIALLSRR